MATIRLRSHARAASPNNTTGICYYGGKPETVVEGECPGLKARADDQLVHLRDEYVQVACVVCGQEADVWMDSREKWEGHPSRCKGPQTISDVLSHDPGEGNDG